MGGIQAMFDAQLIFNNAMQSCWKETSPFTHTRKYLTDVIWYSVSQSAPQGPPDSTRFLWRLWQGARREHKQTVWGVPQDRVREYKSSSFKTAKINEFISNKLLKGQWAAFTKCCDWHFHGWSAAHLLPGNCNKETAPANQKASLQISARQLLGQLDSGRMSIGNSRRMVTIHCEIKLPPPHAPKRGYLSM